MLFLHRLQLSLRFRMFIHYVIHSPPTQCQLLNHFLYSLLFLATFRPGNQQFLLKLFQVLFVIETVGAVV